MSQPEAQLSSMKFARRSDVYQEMTDAITGGSCVTKSKIVCGIRHLLDLNKNGEQRKRHEKARICQIKFDMNSWQRRLSRGVWVE